jgi:hypothetical protein
MPDMSIKKETQDKIDQHIEQNTPKPQNEMFDNMKLEVKPIDIPPTIKEDIKVIDDETKPVKAKRKMTEKQLEALARGRITSAKNRVEKAKNNKRTKAIEVNTPAPNEYIERPQERYVPPPMPQPPQQVYRQPDIDYDKIINGVSNIFDQRAQRKLQAEEDERQINNNVAEFEAKIREDERVKIAERYKVKEAEQKKAKAQKTTENVYHRQPVNNITENPYAYAFGLNSRKNFKRY